MSCDTSTLDYEKGVMLYQSYKRPHMPSTAAKPKGVEEGSAAVKGVKGKKSFEATLKESAERVREELPVFDVRPAHGQFNIDVHGFITAHMTTAMPQTLEVISDKDETEIRKTYWPEVEALARRTVTTNDGRSPKYAFAVGTQKFVPLTREEASKIDDPFGALSATYARIAHADFSEVVGHGLSHASHAPARASTAVITPAVTPSHGWCLCCTSRCSMARGRCWRSAAYPRRRRKMTST
jgi:hypothetical protein